MNEIYFRRIGRLAFWGFKFGSIFAAWAAIVAAFGGSLTLNIRGHHTHVGLIIGIYLVGGAAAGTVVGLLFPLVRRPIGAAFVGIIATIPIAAGVMLAYTGFAHWGIQETATVGIMAVILGSTIGVGYREIFWADEEKNP
jgi:hypothetical protein